MKFFYVVTLVMSAFNVNTSAFAGRASVILEDAQNLQKYQKKDLRAQAPAYSPTGNWRQGLDAANPTVLQRGSAQSKNSARISAKGVQPLIVTGQVSQPVAGNTQVNPEYLRSGLSALPQKIGIPPSPIDPELSKLIQTLNALLGREILPPADSIIWKGIPDKIAKWFVSNLTEIVVAIQKRDEGIDNLFKNDGSKQS